MSFSKWGKDGNLGQKDCLVIGGILGAIFGIVATCWLAKLTDQPISISSIVEGAKNGFKGGIGKSNALEFIPERIVRPVPQFAIPQPIQQFVDITKEIYLLY